MLSLFNAAYIKYLTIVQNKKEQEIGQDSQPCPQSFGACVTTATSNGYVVRLKVVRKG